MLTKDSFCILRIKKIYKESVQVMYLMTYLQGLPTFGQNAVPGKMVLL